MTKEKQLVPLYTKEELTKVKDAILSGTQLDYILKKTPIIK